MCLIKDRGCETDITHSAMLLSKHVLQKDIPLPIGEMSTILALTPEDREKLHPVVVKRLEDAKASIDRELPLDVVSDEDLNNYLTDDEKHEFDRYKKEIGVALTKCLDVGADEPTDSTTLQLSLIQFGLDLRGPISGIESLLRRVHQRKIKETKEERRWQEQEARQQEEEARKQQEKQEESERWRAASGRDSFSSVTSFTASSRNSLVYLPCGILFTLTPPSFYSTRLWCPLNLSYTSVVLSPREPTERKCSPVTAPITPPINGQQIDPFRVCRCEARTARLDAGPCGFLLLSHHKAISLNLTC